MSGPSGSQPGVLMVTGAYFPELSGGGLQCRAIVDALRAEVRSAVLTTSTDRSLPVVDQVNGTPVYRVFIDVSNHWSKLKAAGAMARAFLTLAPSTDVVHLHGFSQKSILLVLLAKLFGKRIVLTLHTAGQDEPEVQSGPASWAYACVDMYLAVNAPLADSLRSYGVPPERIVRVSNGLDTTRFRPAAPGEQEQLRRTLDLPVDGVLILFVGFFSADKGPQVLFDAWRRIATGAGLGSVLVYVGATQSQYYEVDATIAPGIRNIAQREGLAERIVFAGETPAIEQYYRAADLFVFPTRREAFGMVLVEAMASGLPCIASRIPGVTDDIVDDDETGVLVEPHDVSALSAALSRVLTDRAFASRLGQAAREDVAARFAIERTARLTLDAYRQLLQTPAAVTRR
jgi:glycosyltransferase involved in cell wall biosynthesis